MIGISLGAGAGAGAGGWLLNEHVTAWVCQANSGQSMGAHRQPAPIDVFY
jgi:glutamate synthase domain-containing protein 2